MGNALVSLDLARGTDTQQFIVSLGMRQPRMHPCVRS